MSVLTAGDAQDPHDADDGGIDGERSAYFNLLQSDSHHRQQNDGQVQLIPSEEKKHHHGTERTSWRSSGALLCVTSDAAHLSLKKRLKPNAMSFSMASTTNVELKK